METTVSNIRPDSPESSISDNVLRFWEEPVLEPLPVKPLSEAVDPRNVFAIMESMDPRSAQAPVASMHDEAAAGVGTPESLLSPRDHLDPSLFLNSSVLSSPDPSIQQQQSPVLAKEEESSNHDKQPQSPDQSRQLLAVTPQSEGSLGELYKTGMPHPPPSDHQPQPEPFEDGSFGEDFSEVFHSAMQNIDEEGSEIEEEVSKSARLPDFPPQYGDANSDFDPHAYSLIQSQYGSFLLPGEESSESNSDSQVPDFPLEEGTSDFAPSMLNVQIPYLQGMTVEGHLHDEGMADVDTMMFGIDVQENFVNGSGQAWAPNQTVNERVEAVPLLPVFNIPDQLVIAAQQNIAESNQMGFGQNQVLYSAAQRRIPINSSSTFFFGTIPNVSHEELSTMFGFTIPCLPPECTTCQVLRRMMHTNATTTKRMEIHGQPGLEFHGILTMHIKNEPEGSNYQQQRFELNTFEDARSVLINYLCQHVQGISVLVNDSTCDMYTHHLGIAQPLPTPESSVAKEENQKETAIAGPSDGRGRGGRRGSRGNIGATFKVPKSAMAMQRERTANMKLEDLYGYMHLPIAEAARRLFVCPTVLKKVCRRNELPRWPYRKIKALDRTIQTLEQSLATNRSLDRATVLTEIHKLNLQKEAACRPRPAGSDSSDSNDDDGGEEIGEIFK